ncbi:MAG: amidohydrolase family protein [Sphingomonadales bacterium]|nr:amidohydrolase family protein [Sphingomonadales bacterium]
MTITRRARHILVAGLAALLLPTSAHAEERQLVLRNVTVIDPAATTADGARLEGRTIVIAGSRIEAILPPESPVPADAHIVDAAGKFAVPAFWDMHAHVPGDPVRARAALHMQFANGVLHMRDMGTDLSLAEIKQLMAATARRDAPLARIIATPWHIADGRDERRTPTGGDAARFQIENKREANGLVDFVHRQGINFLKPYDSMSAESFRALAKAARKQGIAVSGHIPRQITVSEAIALGQVAIEHAQSLTWACAPIPDTVRRDYYLADPRRRFERNLAYPAFAAFTADTVDRYDETACRALLKTMAERQVRYVPTLVTRRFDVLAAFREYRDDPLLAYIDADTRKDWARDAANYAALDTATRVALYRFLLHAMALTVEAHRAGVPILVGSDSPDSYIFPGFSYHLEMEMLAEAGLPPLAILKAATLEAARFAKDEADYGTIAPNRVADILLLDADPLADISNTRRIDAVIAAGKYWDRAALDALLADARATAASAGSDRE